MSKGVLFFAVLYVMAVFTAGAAYAGVDDSPRSVEDMAAAVISLFPRAEGVVTKADDKTVGIDIGSDAGLKPGMEVLLFRRGKPIIHPVTKAVLGSTELPLGAVRLTQVGGDGSTGMITEILVTRIVEGDTARLSTEPDALRVTVEENYDTVLLDRLMRELRASGRFEITGPDEVKADAQPTGGAVSSLASEGGAGYVLGFATSPAPEKGRLVVSLKLSGPGGQAALDLVETVDATPEVYGETQMDFPLVRGDYRDFFITEDLPFRGKHMDAGDVDGDGKNEVVVSDGQGLVVYRFEDRILRELWREEGLVTNKHLSVECADLNGNGIEEIYVTNFSSDGAVNSYVVEYSEGGYSAVCGPVGVLFRVLDVPGRPSMLITTTKGSDAPYSGIILEYSWAGGKLVKGEKVDLPYRIKDPYGFVLADLVPEKEPDGGEAGDGEDKGPFHGLEVVWVDDSDYVQVLDMDGNRLWKSPEHFGGYDNYFELDKKDLALPTVDPRGKVKGRIIVKQDAGGQDVFILTRNVPLTYATKRFKGYSTSDILSLTWDGVKMEAGWGIRNIDGYISDIFVGDAAGRGSEEITVLLEPTLKILKKSKSLPLGSVGSLSNLTADRSSLLVYKVPLR